MAVCTYNACSTRPSHVRELGGVWARDYPSQRSKYTGGVALRMRIYIAVQRLSRKCVEKKNTPGPDLTGMGDNGIMIINKLYLAGVVEMG